MLNACLNVWVRLFVSISCLCWLAGQLAMICSSPAAAAVTTGSKHLRIINQILYEEIFPIWYLLSSFSTRQLFSNWVNNYDDSDHLDEYSTLAMRYNRADMEESSAYWAFIQRGQEAIKCFINNFSSFYFSVI